MRNIPLTLNRIKHPLDTYEYNETSLERDYKKANVEAAIFGAFLAITVLTTIAFFTVLFNSGNLAYWGLAWIGAGMFLVAATSMSLTSWVASKSWIKRVEAYMEDVVKVTACLKANKLAKGYETVIANQLLTTDLVPFPKKGRNAYLTLKATPQGASLMLLKLKRS